MSSDSSQKFLKQNRPPRVHISYEDPYNSEKQVELPFVMGVMADLSGNASDVDKPEMSERGFKPVDMDNFDDYMTSVAPAVAFRVENRLGDASGEQLGVKIVFSKLSDFEPAAVARQVPPLKALLEAREQLANLQRYMDGKSNAERQLKDLLSNPELMRLLRDRAPAAIPMPKPAAAEDDDVE